MERTENKLYTLALIPSSHVGHPGVKMF